MNMGVKDQIFYIIVIILLISGPATLWAGYSDATYWNNVRAMPYTNCTVTETYYKWDGNNYYYDVYINYAYAVDGINYSGVCIIFMNGEYDSEKVVKAEAEKYPAGSEMQTRYVESNPASSRLMIHEYDGSLITISMGWFALLSAPSMVLAYHRKRIRRWMKMD